MLPKIKSWLLLCLTFVLCFFSIHGYYSAECNHCYVHTDGNTEYSDYIYPTREDAKQACLNMHVKCGSHLNPGYQECLRREYTSICHGAMSTSIAAAGYTNTPCHFTDNDLEACIKMAGIQELTRGDCYAYEQLNGRYRYQAPGISQIVWGTCSSWSCQNCDYNRGACVNRCQCEAYSPFYCPSPSVTVPENNHYWNRITKDEYGNEIPWEPLGCARDCLEEWLGCRISCVQAPSLAKRVDYGKCISKCLCDIHLVFWCPTYGYPAYGQITWTARTASSPESEKNETNSEDKKINIGDLPTADRQDGYSYNTECEQRCSSILYS